MLRVPVHRTFLKKKHYGLESEKIKKSGGAVSVHTATGSNEKRL